LVEEQVTALQAEVQGLKSELSRRDAEKAEFLRKIAQIETARAETEFQSFTLGEKLEDLESRLTRSEVERSEADAKASAANAALAEAAAGKTAAEEALAKTEEALREEKKARLAAEEALSKARSFKLSTKPQRPPGT
jgi:chromosome segregation ATPase